MKGATLLGDRTAEVREFPDPEPGPGEVRIAVRAAGLCGSDLHYYRAAPGELGVRRGVVIGHEPSGVVDSVGEGCRSFRVGDRVTVNHTMGCGSCEHCRRGETVLCEENLGIAASGRGGDAEYVVLPEEYVLALPTELRYRDGAFVACTGATAWGALRKLALYGGQTLVVFGLGPVGLSGIVLGTAMGLRVIAVDVNGERLEFARGTGAAAIVDASGRLVPEAIRELTHGRGADGSFETSGSATGQRDALTCLAPKGRAVYVGLGDSVPSISPEFFIHRELTLLGSKVLPGTAVPELCRFLIDTGCRFEPLVTHAYPLGEAPRAFREFDSGGAGKFVFDLSR